MKSLERTITGEFDCGFANPDTLLHQELLNLNLHVHHLFCSHYKAELET
jgi:hypothetical protein